ncbi:type II toxin-antitoxin system antitoxin DNA ADP-ribosyl glycohydrolase DarG [Haliangium sp.]|uniref:type II toxin-antitoxin system antitoxin DNA ADP-ribosyl glycohydrolase DarG n=1 Tax=Haliangium sp. TaxID=2663208 RepID=UPI003D12B88D
MIRYTRGDILAAETEAVINTVNCVGVMGRGIALQFKRAFPENFKAYAAACRRDEVAPGRMFVFDTGRLTPPRWIINFPTKRHWRNKSRIEDIEAGLVALVDEVRTRGIRSLAIPPLGCGLGGLRWSAVRPLIAQAFAGVDDVDVLVFEPAQAPARDDAGRDRAAPAMTPGRAALVALMHRYLGGRLDPDITLLEVHKLMYFMQEAGEPLRLDFVAGHYGPYAKNLRHVLSVIEGHLTSGYADGADDPRKVLSLLPDAVATATRFLDDQPETRIRAERVSEIVDGFESVSGLELLATVHWVLRDRPDMSAEDMTAAVHDWNRHKRQFTTEQMLIARERLDQLGWLGDASA